MRRLVEPTGRTRRPTRCTPSRLTTAARSISRLWARKLDQVLSKTYREKLAHLARGAILDLAGSMPQRELELLLGLSQAYISKVKNGTETPSAALTAALVLLANDPSRCEEVRYAWSADAVALTVPGQRTPLSRPSNAVASAPKHGRG